MTFNNIYFCYLLFINFCILFWTLAWTCSARHPTLYSWKHEINSPRTSPTHVTSTRKRSLATASLWVCTYTHKIYSYTWKHFIIIITTYSHCTDFCNEGATDEKLYFNRPCAGLRSSVHRIRPIAAIIYIYIFYTHVCARTDNNNRISCTTFQTPRCHCIVIGDSGGLVYRVSTGSIADDWQSRSYNRIYFQWCVLSNAQRRKGQRWTKRKIIFLMEVDPQRQNMFSVDGCQKKFGHPYKTQRKQR